jgi:hypothetical protein
MRTFHSIGEEILPDLFEAVSVQEYPAIRTGIAEDELYLRISDLRLDHCIKLTGYFCQIELFPLAFEDGHYYVLKDAWMKPEILESLEKLTNRKGAEILTHDDVTILER